MKKVKTFKIVVTPEVVQAALIAWHEQVTITREGSTLNAENGMKAALAAAFKASETRD